MTLIQEKIKEAILEMGEKSKFTDAVLSKKLREILKIDGKKKAVIAFADLMAAMESLCEEKKFFSVTVTSANALIIEKSQSMKEVSLENRQRRQKHEKSQELFTNADVKISDKAAGKIKSKSIRQKRTERKSLNIYENFEDEN